MIKLKNITGNKLKLIDLDMKYLDDMYEYSSNPRMYEYFEFEAHKTKNETKSYLKKLIKRSNKKNAHWWFIQLKKTSKIIGSFGVHDIDRIKNSTIKQLIVTDTVLITKDKMLDNMKIVTVAEVFAEAIQRIFNGKSVSALFEF